MSCKCQECGKQYKLDLSIPDEIWNKIKPTNKSKGSGLLCGSCILNKLENLYGYSSFQLMEENIESPSWPEGPETVPGILF